MELNSQLEEWRDIPFDTAYMVSNFGRVKSKARLVRSGPLTGNGFRSIPEKILRPWLVKGSGYPQLSLSKKKRYSVHYLVLEAFVGPRPEGMECAHADGVRTNAHLSNLRWATKQSNMADKIAHGTAQRGEKNNMTKLSADQVRAIRADNRKRAHIAKDYGVTAEAISHIVLRKNWAWLD